MKKIHAAILIGASALVLAACGSSGGDDAPAPPPAAASDIPASATTDAAGLVSYVNQQVGMSSDTGEPLVVGDATTLPVDDTTETSL
jgi:ABC-type glycerol-3-phosphate transport system substrate-binding protein